MYLIEVAHGKGKKQKSVPLADFAFRRFADLGLAKQVTRIDEGAVEMTPSQHKGRNLMFITTICHKVTSSTCLLANAKPLPSLCVQTF